MCKVFFQELPYYFTMYIIFRVLLPRHWQGLYGVLSFGFPGGSAVLRPNILWSTPTVQKSTIKSTLMVSLSIPKFVYVWQTCDGLNTVSSYCILHKYSVKAWHDVQADAQANLHMEGHQEGCDCAIVQNSSISMGVGSSFFLSFTLVEQVCHHLLGVLHLWNQDLSMLSILGQPVHIALMVNEVCLLVAFWLASWPVTHPLHVALEWVHYYHLPPQHFHRVIANGQQVISV